MSGPFAIFENAYLRVPAKDLKMLREELCLAQACSPRSGHLQTIINEIDRHRPLGPDGKHGNRHTTTCGCDL